MAQYEPRKIKKLQPLHSDVIVCDMEFDVRITRSGIIIPNDNGTGSGIRPRWGRVYAVGPDQKEFQPGKWILVSHGRWTRGVEIDDGNGEKVIRKIDPKDILFVSEHKPQDDTMSECLNGRE